MNSHSIGSQGLYKIVDKDWNNILTTVDNVEPCLLDKELKMIFKGKYIGVGGNSFVFKLLCENINNGEKSELAIKLIKKTRERSLDRTKFREITAYEKFEKYAIMLKYKDNYICEENNIVWICMGIGQKVEPRRYENLPYLYSGLKSVLNQIEILHIHDCGHRDIKISNCLVFHDEIKLSDYGLIYSISDDDFSTESGEYIGNYFLKKDIKKNLGKVSLEKLTYIKCVDMYQYIKMLMFAILDYLELKYCSSLRQKNFDELIIDDDFKKIILSASCIENTYFPIALFYKYFNKIVENNLIKYEGISLLHDEILNVKQVNEDLDVLYTISVAFLKTSINDKSKKHVILDTMCSREDDYVFSEHIFDITDLESVEIINEFRFEKKNDKNMLYYKINGREVRDESITDVKYVEISCDEPGRNRYYIYQVHTKDNSCNDYEVSVDETEFKLNDFRIYDTNFFVSI